MTFIERVEAFVSFLELPVLFFLVFKRNDCFVLCIRSLTENMCFLPHRISAVLHGARLENFVVADSYFAHRCTCYTVLTEILRTNDLDFQIYTTCAHFDVGVFLFRDLVLVSVQKKKDFLFDVL